jgi:tetratricopeptide (TPR) repeat protein
LVVFTDIFDKISFLKSADPNKNKFELILDWIYQKWYFTIPAFIILLIISLGKVADSVEKISTFYRKYVRKQRHIFDSNDKRLKVLIVPFIEISKERNEDIAYVIKKRLDNLDKIDSLNINTYYYEGKVNQQFTEDKAKQLMKKENVDLIIYGDYNTLPDESHQISICYLTSDKLNIVENTIRSQFGEYVSATIQDIREGKLQGSIEFIIYWIKAMSRYKIWDFSLRNDPKNAQKEAIIYLKHLNKTIDLNPKFSKSYFNRGCIYSFSLSKYDDAIRDYSNAIKLNPNYVLAYNNRGIIYGVVKKNYSAAIKDFTKAIDINPVLPYLYCNLALVFLHNKNPNQAIKYYSLAVNLGHNDPIIFYNRGNAYSEVRQLDRAIEDYNTAINLKANYPEAWFNRAITYFIKGDLEKSLYDYSETIKLDPNKAMAFSNRGDIYQTQGKIELALINYNRAVEVDPKAPIPYINRGSILISKGNTLEAIKDFDTAIVLDPKNPDAYYNRGQAFRIQKKYDKAVIDFTKAIKLNPNFGDAYRARGELYIEMGLIEKSLPDFAYSEHLKIRKSL